jgi:hypothetical protein
VQGPEQDGAGEIQPGLRGPLLQQFGEARHGKGLEVLGDLLEIFQRCALACSQYVKGLLQAMVDVVLDKHTLGLADGFFHGVQLLGDIDAGPTVFDHADDAAQVTLRTLQPLDDIAMTPVLMAVLVIAHALSLVRR